MKDPGRVDRTGNEGSSAPDDDQPVNQRPHRVSRATASTGHDRFPLPDDPNESDVSSGISILSHRTRSFWGLSRAIVVDPTGSSTASRWSFHWILVIILTARRLSYITHLRHRERDHLQSSGDDLLSIDLGWINLTWTIDVESSIIGLVRPRNIIHHLTGVVSGHGQLQP